MYNFTYNKPLFDLDNLNKWLIIFVPISTMAGNLLLNLNVILVDLLFIYFFFKKKIKFEKYLFYIAIFLSVIFLINFLTTSNNYLTGRATLGIIRYFIFFVAFSYFLENEENKKFFFKIIFYILVFVLIDVLIQYIFGRDIFGNEYSTQHGKRLSGPFGDEYVVGAYLSKLYFLGIMYLFLRTKNNLIYLGYLLASLLIIFLTQERSAFFISFFAFIFFIFFFKIKIKQKFFLLLTFTVILSFFIKYDETTFKKYYTQTIQQLGFSEQVHLRSLEKEIIGDDKSKNIKQHKIETFWDSRYGAHFLTAFQIFNDNKIFGSGIKTFREECELKKYETINSEYSDRRCNTHPHNIYFEILSEGGLVIFIPFCFFIILLYFKNFHNLIKKNDYNYSLINLCFLIILFFPIQTTGSFFSTFNGVFYWILLSIILNNMKLNLFLFSFEKPN